MSKKLDMLH